MLDELLNNKELVGKMAWDRLIMGREAKEGGRKGRQRRDREVHHDAPHIHKERPVRYAGLRLCAAARPIDPRSFEEIIRESIAIQKLNDSLAKDIVVTDEEAFEAYRKENEKIKLSYVVFAADNFIEKATVDDAKMKEYYDTHAVEFTIPSKVLEDGTVSEGGIAKFEDVKDNIKGFLSAVEARKLATRPPKRDSRR